MIAAPTPASDGSRDYRTLSHDLGECLGLIEEGLRRLGRTTLLDALLPGLDPSEVRSKLASIDAPSDATIETVYGWRNGTRTKDIRIGDVHLMPGFYLLSLEDSIDYWFGFASNRQWVPSWLPLFADGDDNFYAVEWGDRLGAVRHFRVAQTEHPVEFLSLENMFATIAAAFDRGVYFVDRDGFLEMDDDQFARLAAELNPRVKWWMR